jgi:molybdopterin-guanine dinucleotide biosynthesis protein A
VLIANTPDAREWRPDLQVIGDREPGQGSIGGIHTAVRAGDDPVLVVAWDMPFVPAALLQSLVLGANGWDAFLPESGGPRQVEPLCAVYGSACDSAISRQLERGDRHATGFHRDVLVGTLPKTEVDRHGDAAVMFFNVNTAAELRRAEELCRRG